MREREPDFEDEKMRAWLRRPKEENWEGLGEDPTVMTAEEEMEEISESRTYRLRPTPEAFLLALDVLHTRVGEQLDQMPPRCGDRFKKQNTRSPGSKRRSTTYWT